MQEKSKSSGMTVLKTWLLIWGLGLAGQLCWNMENQWFNTFVYAKIAKNPDIINWMVAISAVATTFSTFFFGTVSDRRGSRRPFVAYGYIIWGLFTIAFGLTEFISKTNYVLAGVLVVIADMVMSFFGSMGNDAGFNAWTNDIMTKSNRGAIGAALATQPVIGTILGTVVGGMLVGNAENPSDRNYMLLFVVMGGFVILVGILSIFTLKDSPLLTPNKQGSFWKQFASVFNFKKFFSQKELVWVNIAVTVFFIAFNIYFVHLGNYMIYYLGFKEGDMGLIEGISLIGAMVLAIPATFLINKNKSPLLGYISVALNVVGLLILYFFVRPNNVDTSTIFNWLLILGVFFIGAGYVVILQTTTIWAKQLYPKDAKGQFEGVRILFFVLFPMIFGPMIASPVIKNFGVSFDNPLSGQMEYVPNEVMFIVAAVISLLTIVPLIFAHKEHNKRIKAEALQLLAENADIEMTTTTIEE